MERSMSNVMAIILGFIAVAFVQCMTAQPTVHVVGDTIGWNIPQSPSAYSTWASSKKFVVGDILTFNFATNAHDVVQVPKESYDKCSSDDEIGETIRTGPANVTLSTQGEHYYICTIGTHCQSGQKLAITVSASSTASPPSSAPKPPPTTTPSPASSPANCTPSPASSPKAEGPTAQNTPPSGPDSSSPPAILAGFFFSLLSIALSFCFSM